MKIFNSNKISIFNKKSGIFNIYMTKAHTVKAMVFPGVIYGCKSWTLKKSERQRIDAFELW